MGKKILLSLLAILTGLPLLAQQISEDDARAVAARFWQSGAAVGVRSDVQAQPQLAYTSRKAGKSCFYVFNRGTDGGFVIVGADGAAEEILGYSDNGTFDFDRIPDNLRWWLGQYEEQISAAIEQGVTAETRTRQRTNATRAAKTDIPYLVQTSWNQDAPYNDMCPKVGDVTCYTGCVATAMAQIMNYHEWPKQGTGSHSYTWENISASADFGSTTYDWANMLDDYTGAATDAQKQAVAQLMYHCGVSVEMMYGVWGSGAYDANVPAALTTYFGYDKGLTLLDRSYYSNEEWEQQVYDELAARRPVYYSGATDNNEGHAFVCDGYRSSNNTFHINWGWGGYCDGYYSLSASNALAPEGSGAGGGEAGKGYIYHQLVIAGIQPDQGNSPAPAVMALSNCEVSILNNSGQALTSANREQLAILHVEFSNISTSLARFNLGLRFTDQSTGEVYYVGSDYTVSVEAGYSGSANVSIYFSSVPKVGTYDIEAVYKLVGEETWKTMRRPAECGNAVQEFTLTGDEAAFSVEQCYFPDNNAVSKSNFELHVAVKNLGAESATPNMTGFLFPGAGGYNFAYFPLNFGEIAAGATKEIVVSEYYLMSEGTDLENGNSYLLVIYDEKNVEQKRITFTVNEQVQTYTLTYKVDGEVYKAVQLEAGATITPEEGPAKEGHTFKEWKDLPAVMPAADLTVEAVYTVNSYSLVYMVDGKEYKRETVEYGAAITPAEAPAKEGYTFVEWDGLPETMPAKDVTVSAVYSVQSFTLTYKVDGEVYETVELEADAAITPLEAPAKEGHTFVEWEGLPETMPAADVTVEAVYTVNSYELIYMVDGEEYERVSVEYGAEITPLEGPAKEGSTFVRWDGLPETMPAEDVTVNAVYAESVFTLTYMVDGEVYKEFQMEAGAAITPLAAPEKEGHTFSGWEGLPETMPAEDVTVTGTFTVNSYQLIYMVDGEEYKRETLEYGAEITPAEAPAKEGSTFVRWDGLPETMPAADVTVNAVYAESVFTLTYVVDGEVYKEFQMEAGAAITPLAAPEKEGHTFSGWDGLPETMPAEDVTVTGSFTVNTYTLTYYLDGEVYLTETVEYGAEIVPPVVEDTDEYIFAGWQDVPETMPAHDVEVHGATRPNGITFLTTGTRVDVYSLQGVLVRKGIAVERLRTELPTGMYIVNGQKVWIKKK